MNPPTATIGIRRFDECVPAALDGQVWHANLAALRAENAALAQTLERVRLPQTWRPAVALDETVTFRTEPRGMAAVWLADTAVPETRARALLADFQPGELNPTLPTIAAGAELRQLLDTLPFYKAIYVFENDLAQLAAVFRVCNFASAIAAGRCIILDPGREEPCLNEVLEQHPGLLPPGNIARIPTVSESRLERILAICERVAREVLPRRAARLHEIAGTAPNANDERDPRAAPRLTLLCLKADRGAAREADSIVRAAAAQGWSVHAHVLCGPRDVHPLAAVHSAASLPADIQLCVNHPRDTLRFPARGRVCEWYLDAHEAPAQPAAGVMYLAGTPRVRASLRAAGCAESALADLLLAIDREQGVFDVPGDVAGRVVIVGDLPDDRPSSCGIEQPTHKLLWQQLRTLIEAGWETREGLLPEAILARAESAAQIRFGDGDLRRDMLRRIECALIPGAVLETIRRVIHEESRRVCAIGTGWARWASEELTVLSESVFAPRSSAAAGRSVPWLCVFVGLPEPLTPGLLQVAASGIPIAIFSPGGDSRAPALGNILHPDQHFEPFSGAKELRALLAAFRADPTRFVRRAERVATMMLAHHTTTARLAELRQRLFPQ